KPDEGHTQYQGREGCDQGEQIVRGSPAGQHELADTGHEVDRKREADQPCVGCRSHASIYSDRSACSTSTRDARAAGISDARIAAPMSTVAAPNTANVPGICTVAKNLAAARAST